MHDGERVDFAASNGRRPVVLVDAEGQQVSVCYTETGGGADSEGQRRRIQGATDLLAFPTSHGRVGQWPIFEWVPGQCASSAVAAAIQEESLMSWSTFQLST